MIPEHLNTLVRQLNAELRRLHEEGESVFVKVNGWVLKLQKGELVEVDITVNDCNHKWTRCRGPVDIDAGGPKSNFQLCRLCGMTR